MQAASDIFLGWCPASGLDGRAPRLLRAPALGLEALGRDRDASTRAGFEVYARICGWTLARAHARSGDRVAIAAYLGGGDSFDRAIADFAEAYADQSERDHAALLDGDRLRPHRGRGRLSGAPGRRGAQPVVVRRR